MKRTLQHPLLHLAIGLISFTLLYFSVSFTDTTSIDYDAFNASLNQKISQLYRSLGKGGIGVIKDRIEL